jgi:hypothetical protein
MYELPSPPGGAAVIRPSLRLRASIVVAAGAALAGTLAGCSSHTIAATHVSASPAAATTVTQTFTPFDSTGAITAPISGHQTGDCWTSSIALPRNTTYRCVAGNQILDPCFAPPHPTTSPTLACFADPWSAGVLLALDQPLPKPDGTPRSSPWALELAGGIHCVALTGTIDQVGSLDLSYGCGGSAEAGLVSPSTPGGALSVQYRSADAQPLRTVAVRTAWH